MKTHLRFAPFQIAVVCAALAGGAAMAMDADTPPAHQETAGQAVDDTWITTKVKAAFVDDHAVSALDVKVQTTKGVVQLSGFANNAAEISRAGEIAKNIRGVKSVRNDVRLKNMQPSDSPR